MCAVFPGLQRLDGLPEQLEAVILQRIVDARRPLLLAAAALQVDVVLFEAVNTVAAGFLGGGTGAVGGAQQ